MVYLNSGMLEITAKEKVRMKNHQFDRYIYMGITAISVIVAATLVVFLFLERRAVGAAVNRIFSILAPIIYGAVLAFLMAPVYNYFQSRVHAGIRNRISSRKVVSGMSKTAGTAASLVFLAAVMISLSSMIIPQLYSSIMGIVYAMPTYVQNIYDWLTGLFADNPDLEASILLIYQQAVANLQAWTGNELIPNLQNLENLQGLEKIIGGVSSGVLNVVNVVKNFLIGIIVMIYLLNIKDVLFAQAKKIIYALFPLRIANATVEEFRFIHKIFSGFLIGKLIDSLIIGILCFICLNLMKMPFTLLISVIVGVTNIIPFFGPFIGAIPSAVLVFLISPKQCLYFVLFILLLQQFDGNILGPKILGDTTGISSFWVLASILFFGGLYGFIGMIIAVPATAVIFDLFSKLQRHFLRKKCLSSDVEDYMGLQRIDEDSGRYVRRDE